MAVADVISATTIRRPGGGSQEPSPRRVNGFAGNVVGDAYGRTHDRTRHSLDVLRDRLALLGVPILGGLPIGHGRDPIAIPLGTAATLDADAGTLRVRSAVC